MTGRLPSILERLFKKSGLPPSEIMAKVERLSDAYTRGGDPVIGDEATALAYALYFLPEHLQKPRLVLAELMATGLLPGGKVLRAADLGAGPGTAVWALADLLADDPSRVVDASLFDRSPHLLGIAQKIAAGFGAAVRVNTVNADFTAGRSFPTGTGVVFFVNALSELKDDGRAVQAVTKALAAIADDGVIVIIEPVTDRGIATATAVRKALGVGAAMPCPAPGDCPSITANGRLCRFDVKAPVPRALQRVVTAHHQRQKFCVVVLARRHAPREEGTCRVIKPFVKVKWGFETEVCDGRALRTLCIHSRKFSDRRVAEAIGSCDLVRVDAPATADGRKITIDDATKLAVVHSFAPEPEGRA